MSAAAEPKSCTIINQRARLHYADWGNEGAPLLILVHGVRDHARSWDAAARELSLDYHVIAPDLRGHGDSDWSSNGAYSLLSFVQDLADLIDGLTDGPVSIVGHSLGAVISLHYTSLFPGRVAKLVSIEGIDAVPAWVAELRLQPVEAQIMHWIEHRRSVAVKKRRSFSSLEDAMDRMWEGNPSLGEDQVRQLAAHAVRQNDDGTFSWKFDPYVRALTPLSIDEQGTKRLRGLITCPVLLAWGRDGWGGDPAGNGTLKQFRNAAAMSFDGGHWLHHDCHDAFMASIQPFLAS